MKGIDRRETMESIQHVAERVTKDGIVLANAWRIQGKWQEALALLDALLPAGTTPNPTLYLAKARVLNDQALFGNVPNRTERDETLALALKQAELANDKRLWGALWSIWGMSLHVSFFENQRSAEPAHEMNYFERGLAFRTEADDALGIAESLFQIGLVHHVIRNDVNSALPYFQQSYEQAVALNDAMLASYAIRHLGYARAEQGDMAGAQVAFEESLHLRQTIGFTPGVAMAELALARLLVEMGQSTRALLLLESARNTFVSLGSDGWVSMIERDIAAI
jgi:tetratricopeptide (TPR) repeat protein